MFQYAAMNNFQLSIFALMLCFLLALHGLALLAFSALVGILVFTGQDDGNRQDNLSRCYLLAKIGTTAMLPLVVWFCWAAWKH